MKKYFIPAFVAIILLLTACNPKVSTVISKEYPALNYNTEVMVLSVKQPAPENAELLGDVKIGDTGFSTNCGYELVIEKAKLEARKIGGNLLKITKHKLPSAFGSSCHQIEANILKIDDIQHFKLAEPEEQPLLDVDYAVLNVYRYSGAGSLVGYDLYLGDSVICRVRNNYKTTLHIKKDGRNSLWAKTEAKDEVPINVEMGKTYYLRCGVSMGAFVGHPVLELVDYRTGKAEFESFNAKHQ